jgi:hypothetical protein
MRGYVSDCCTVMASSAASWSARGRATVHLYVRLQIENSKKLDFTHRPN